MLMMMLELQLKTDEILESLYSINVLHTCAISILVTC